VTSALECGVWLAPRPGRFTPGKDPVPIVQEAGWAPGPVWTCAKNLAPRTVQPLASRYTDWALKSIPLQAWTGPECSIRLRLQDFRTDDTWRWLSQPYVPAAFTPQDVFLVLVSLRDWVEPRVIVRSEWFSKWKMPMTPLGIATSQLLAQCVSQLLLRAPGGWASSVLNLGRGKTNKLCCFGTPSVVQRIPKLVTGSNFVDSVTKVDVFSVTKIHIMLFVVLTPCIVIGSNVSDEHTVPIFMNLRRYENLKSD
jgi:hypothetical protein